MMSGMSGIQPNNEMLLARNNLKNAEKEKLLLRNRINKLSLEEQRSQRRVKDLQREQNFYLEMQ